MTTSIILVLFTLANGKLLPVPNPNPHFVDQATCEQAGALWQAKAAGNAYSCLPWQK